MIKNIRSFICILMLIYAFSVLGLCICAFLLWRFSLNVSQIRTACCIIYGSSCLIGGFLAGKTVKRKRILWGLLIGFSYFIILFLLSIPTLQTPPAVTSSLLLSLFLCLFFGFLGAFFS